MKRICGVLMVLVLACAGCGGGGAGGGDAGGDDGGAQGPIVQAPSPSPPAPAAQPQETAPSLDTSYQSIDIRDAVAILNRHAGTIQKVTTAGELIDILPAKGAYASAQDAFIASDGNLYIMFDGSLDGSTCSLLQVSRDNEFLCIRDITRVWSYWPTNFLKMPTVQLDAAGNIYYAGLHVDDQDVVIAKYDILSGEVTYFILAPGYLENFHVMGDGRVYLQAHSEGSNIPYVGVLDQLAVGADRHGLLVGDVLAFFELPDGALYAGISEEGGFGGPSGVRRITAQGVDVEYYIGSGGTGYDTSSCGSAFAEWLNCVCREQGIYIASPTQTENQHVYVLAVDGSGLWEYWPVVMPVWSTVLHPRFMSAVGTKLLLEGGSIVDDNRLVLFDPATLGEINYTLDENYAFQGMDYSPETDTALFHGVRASDGTYVLGKVDLAGQQAPATAEIIATMDAPPAGWRYDLQAFR
jgi:hypothetical protein